MRRGAARARDAVEGPHRPSPLARHRLTGRVRVRRWPLPTVWPIADAQAAPSRASDSHALRQSTRCVGLSCHLCERVCPLRIWIEAPDSPARLPGDERPNRPPSRPATPAQPLLETTCCPLTAGWWTLARRRGRSGTVLDEPARCAANGTALAAAPGAIRSRNAALCSVQDGAAESTRTRPYLAQAPRR